MPFKHPFLRWSSAWSIRGAGVRGRLDQLAAIDWLGAHSAWVNTALAPEPTGGLIPARIGHRIVLGHWSETIDYSERRREVVAFFNAGTPNAIAEAWRTAGIKHVPLHRTGYRFAVDEGFGPISADDQTVLATLIDSYPTLIQDFGGVYELYDWRSELAP